MKVHITECIIFYDLLIDLIMLHEITFYEKIQNEANLCIMFLIKPALKVRNAFGTLVFLSVKSMGPD